MKKVLGKGLNALIPDSYVNANPADTPAPNLISGDETAGTSEGLQLIRIDAVEPNKDQPRKEFHDDDIEELAASIREKGILQPIIVTHIGQDRYMLICGERRLRAAKRCGLQTVPAVIKEVAGDNLLEWALIENIQRQDLNPLEEAEAYRRLAEERMLSQDEIAKHVGKDRSTVANMLRLLRLPEEVRNYIAEGLLTTGHARALLALLTPEHQRQLARRIAEEKLSVRQVEAIVNRSNVQKRKPKKARHLKPEIVDLENRLTSHLGTHVRLYPRKNQMQGRIEIQYFSLDDLDRILQKLGVSGG